MQTSVILSEADGSRSEPSAKSKDPLPAGTIVVSEGNFYHRLAPPRTDHRPLNTAH